MPFPMEITPELITQYGLMSKISTGNTYLDLIFCMLVPLLLKTLVPLLNSIPKRRDKRNVYKRHIEYTQRSGYYWYDDDDEPRNSVLQQAILNKVNMQVAALSKLNEADLTLKKKQFDAVGAGSDDACGSSCGGVDAATDDDSGGSEDKHAYSYNLAPTEGVWMDLENGIRFMRCNEKTDDKHRTVKITYSLECRDKNGSERLAAFVSDALEVYRKQQITRIDPARYLYMPVLTGFRGAAAAAATAADGDAAGSPSALYKRYKLSEEKSFTSLFHPEKEALLRLVDQFLNKQGKFAIPGYPQKLGFLLYGPPGTGKTSLIKALAQHTKRSIISVPLSKISTNQELMDIVFDSNLKIQNSPSSDSASVSLPFNKTIFVMEDVDAASSVVQRRTPPPPPPASSPPPQPDTPPHGACESPQPSQAAEMAALAEHIIAAKLAAAAAAAGAAARARNAKNRTRNSDADDAGASADDADGSGNKDDDTEDNKDDGDGKGSSASRGKTSASCSSASLSRRSGGTSATTTSAGVNSGWEQALSAFGPSPMSAAAAAFGAGLLFPGEDELNLAGLLNVLDGVVDTPDRIIVMTTNHPEKLDPALIRPGRINKKIYMGRLRVTEALCMMHHYFGPLGDSEEAALRAVFVDDALSPADLESMCAEYDSAAELVEAVAARLAAGGGEEGFKPC